MKCTLLSRVGSNTKIHADVDAKGLPLRLALSSGQAEGLSITFRQVVVLGPAEVGSTIDQRTIQNEYNCFDFTGNCFIAKFTVLAYREMF